MVLLLMRGAVLWMPPDRVGEIMQAPGVVGNAVERDIATGRQRRLQCADDQRAAVAMAEPDGAFGVSLGNVIGAVDAAEADAYHLGAQCRCVTAECLAEDLARAIRAVG